MHGFRRRKIYCPGKHKENKKANKLKRRSRNSRISSEIRTDYRLSDSSEVVKHQRRFISMLERRSYFIYLQQGIASISSWYIHRNRHSRARTTQFYLFWSLVFFFFVRFVNNPSLNTVIQTIHIRWNEHLSIA